jgi:tRNA pseudouridine(38-40) synthase
MTIEYDGTPFRGWAVQPGKPTVEASLREALAATFAS